MAIVRRLLEEGFGQGLIHWLPDRIAPDYVGHLTNGDHYGPEGIRIDIKGYRSMMVDLTVSIEDLFADCDKVARRFTMRGISRDSLVTDAIDGTPIMMTGVERPSVRWSPLEQKRRSPLGKRGPVGTSHGAFQGETVTIPAAIAVVTAAVRVLTPSFARIFATWPWVVRTLTKSAVAISLSVRPRVSR